MENKVDLSSFIKKWDRRTLEDSGSYVSKGFRSFQTAFVNAMKKIATSLDGEVVNVSKGHYDISGFIKRGDKYVYFSYDNGIGIGGRTHIMLTMQGCSGMAGAFNCPFMIRTAKDSKDYSGGRNVYIDVERSPLFIEQLLNK